MIRIGVQDDAGPHFSRRTSRSFHRAGMCGREDGELEIEMGKEVAWKMEQKEEKIFQKSGL